MVSILVGVHHRLIIMIIVSMFDFIVKKVNLHMRTLQIRGDGSTDVSTTPLAFAKPVDPPIEEIVKFFHDAGYECKASLNSIGGVSVEIRISK